MTRPLTRLIVVLFVLTGTLAVVSPGSIAETEGSTLVESIAADASGDDAFAVLESVEGFPAGGGEAIFEPGTEFEETFVYSTVDEEQNRLVGLTRENPIDHPQGSVVIPASPPEQTPEPSASPAPEDDAADAPNAAEFPPSAEAQQGESTGQGDGAQASTEEGVIEGTSSGTAQPTVSASGPTAIPSPCEILLSQTCAEFVAGICSEGLVCDLLIQMLQDPTSLCSEGAVCDLLEQIVEDPLSLCAEGTVCEILRDPTSLCDPEGTGQTCDQWLEQLIPCRSSLDCVEGPQPLPPTCGETETISILMCALELTEGGTVAPTRDPPADTLPVATPDLPGNPVVGADVATDCYVFAGDPAEWAGNVHFEAWLDCSFNKPEIRVVVRGSRWRWWGWQYLARNPDSCQWCRHEEVEDYWNCYGVGTYTYRTRGYGFVKFPNGEWGSGVHERQERFDC